MTTGNEDGGKHVSAQVLYALQHIGLTVPPQSDAYWVGEAGPGPSYLDEGSGGAEQRLDHPEHRLHGLEPPAPGADCSRTPAASPRFGNSTFDWDLTQPGHPNPEYRAPASASR